MSAVSGPTINHGAIRYVVIPLESCLQFALSLSEAGKHWHSHVLSPGCVHNPYDDQYAIVIEDDTEACAYIAPSDQFPEVDKELVKILHGNDILDFSKTSANGGAEDIPSAMLDRLRLIDGNGVVWHHHMNFPACVFNPQPGKWSITIESEEGEFSESFADEPIAILREVEVLYFRNLDRNSCSHAHK